MNKLFVYITVLSLFCLTNCAKTESIFKQEREIDYTAFLSDLYENKSFDEEFEFFIKDLDNNSIPELIIAKNGINSIDVYTFNDKVVELGNHYFETATTRLFSSDNSSYPGIFCYFEGGGLDHYGYITIKDNKLVYEELWNEDYSGISKELGISRERIKEISTDKQLINESNKVYKENSDLSFQRLEKDNIRLSSSILQQQNKEGTESLLDNIFPHKKDFIWYYEGTNDAEKIAILDNITNKDKQYVLTIKSCSEDLTGEATLEDRISYSTIEITDDQIVCDDSIILRAPLVNGNTWATDYKIKPSGIMYKATVEIIEVSGNLIKTKTIINTDDNDIEEQYEEITVYERGIGVISQWYNMLEWTIICRG